MAIIHQCEIELHDSVYFATREIGRLYETETVLHNYALCYALGLVDSDRLQTQVSEEDSYRYFCPTQVPKYAAHLTPLNQQQIYVTPGRSLFHGTVLNTWKYADNWYYVKMQKTQKNIPSFGRTKEIAPESVFECFIIANQELKLPRWIRLGKWMSKAKVTIVKIKEVKRSPTETDFLYPYLLNPLDVMFTHQVFSYDTINMPPVSLIKNVRILGPYYDTPWGKIPANMAYRFSG
jgi:CRISPR-associated protein Csc1